MNQAKKQVARGAEEPAIEFFAPLRREYVPE
jgi:hypothetical protein